MTCSPIIQRPVRSSTSRIVEENPAEWSASFTMGEIPSGFLFTRASNAFACAPDGSPQMFPPDAPRLDFHPLSRAPRGLLVETSYRTNNLVNSANPASQTVSLAAGNYLLWVEGAGSCSCIAGTATGTGFGTATASHAVPFSITSAGTVAFNVSGNLSRFQCENAPVAGANIPSSFIRTEASPATRPAENARICCPDLPLNPTEGTVYVEFELNAYENGFLEPFSLINQDDSVGNSLRMYAWGNSGGVPRTLCRAGGTKFWETTVADFNCFIPGTICRFALAFKAGDYAAAAGNGRTCGLINLPSPALPAGMNMLRLGSNSFTGWVRKASVYPARVPNGQLLAMVTQ